MRRRLGCSRADVGRRSGLFNNRLMQARLISSMMLPPCRCCDVCGVIFEMARMGNINNKVNVPYALSMLI